MSKIDKTNTELNKTYSPNDVENKWYSIWEESNAFAPSSKGNQNYTLMIPPPNVTGSLQSLLFTQTLVTEDIIILESDIIYEKKALFFHLFLS